MNQTEQPELAIETSRGNNVPSAEEVQWLEAWLKESGQWVTAVGIENVCGQDADGRYVRKVAQASDWVISGQKGYKHLEHATAEEISHFANWMESQAKKMISRAERIRRNAHSIFGKGLPGQGTILRQ